MASSQTSKAKGEIIIVGAGIAGLGAAKFLQEKGYNPILLEAQERVGGRLKTNRSLGIAVDEGASWIHGPIKNPITELAKEAGATTFLTDDESFVAYDMDGSRYSEDIIGQAEERYQEILEELDGQKDMSFGEVFYRDYPQYQHNRLWTYMLSAYLEFDTGGDIKMLSSTDFYDDKEFKGEDVIVSNGYDTLVNYLKEGLDIRLQTKVVGIDYSGEKISIQTHQGVFTADHVLLTVPLGVLKKEVITFTPPLPPITQQAIDGLGMGVVNKFLLTWDQAFWEEEIQYIGYTPEEKGKFNLFLNMKTFTKANALMTFAYGDYAVLTEEMTDADIVEQIMTHLKKMYGNDIPQPTHMLRTKWHENPYTFGSYSFARPGLGSKGYKLLKEDVDNKIFFAGEHTIKKYRGTVHGAYLSGIRAAKKIKRFV
ncbi:MAG: NAD(P)/FAD-dependent oxidoreductase [Bacteroidota bacterium]